MASLNLLVIESGVRKQKSSSTQTVDFSSIRIGVSQLQILEATGHFDFSAKKLTNVANGTNPSDAVNLSQLNGSLANKANVDLSNLSPTAINASLVPASNNAINVGSASLRFANVFSVLLKVGASNLTIAEASGHFDFSAKRLTNVADPVGAQDAATKNYVDIVAQGIKPKQAARVATTADIALDENTASIDGVTLADGDRVLVKNQTAPEENGIWIASTSAAWTRATDFDSLSPVDEINGAWVGVQEGTVSAGKVYVQYGTVATIGTDPITFTTFSALSSLIGGDMISVSGATVSVDLSSTGGLESTNPGNAAGQLKIKLDGPSLALSSSGTKVNVDDDTLEIDTAVKVKDHRPFVNDNGSSITQRQIVFIKTNGHVDLAIAATSGIENAYVGVVKDASIATTATGKITVKPGTIVGGFSGLTPGAKQYLSRSTAGALTESLSGFVTNEAVYCVGYAITATEIVYQPQFEYLF